MSKFMRIVLKHAFKFLVWLDWAFPLACYLALNCRRVPGSQTAGRSCPGVLALNAVRFRGDLEVLAESGRFRVYALDFGPQATVWSQFFRPMGFEDYIAQDSRQLAQRQKFRTFLAKAFASLSRLRGIDTVISAAIHYKADLDFGAAAELAGLPYVVLHKENLVTSEAMADFVRERCRRIGAFTGTRVVTHNETMRDIFITSGFAREDQVKALGCLRMDESIERLAAGDRVTADTARPLVTFFSFGAGTGLFPLGMPPVPDSPTEGMVKLFASVHVAFAELARDNPDIDFVVKPKWEGRWTDRIREATLAKGIDVDTIPNLTISDQYDPHDLILRSQVVVSFGSTTLLEAAIAGVPVIMPFFEEVVEDRYARIVPLVEQRDLFDVADSPQALKSLIMDRTQNPNVDPALLARRQSAFERLVTPIDGSAVVRYMQELDDIVTDRRSRRLQPTQADSSQQSHSPAGR